MKQIDRFIDEVCQGLKVSHSLKKHLREELREHLEDEVDGRVTEGMAREEAVA
ncbi:MAG: hypothetical protein KC964_00375 [Candidatus Omnitrophica bacterium]|nr:hypothetical protein [Candidatus Omnitrophota bacterium]